MPILRDMVRIGERRPPALPSTSDQQARRAAILTAATRLGRIRALDRIHAREIAAEAGVALRTLYRYYPTRQLLIDAVATVGDQAAADQRMVGLVQRLGAMDLEDRALLQMVLQVASDALAVEHDIDAER